MLHPNGSGHQFEVQVPSNVPVGNTFYVQIGGGTSHCQDLNNETVHAMVESRIDDSSNVEALTVPDPGTTNMSAPAVNAIHTFPSAQDPPPFSQCLDNAPPTTFNKQSCIDNIQQRPHTTQPPRFQFNSNNSKNSEKRLLVRVPPGVAAGMTLHVKIPDEPGRMLSAQVPIGNVQEFYVTYEPEPRSSSRCT